MVLNTVTIYNEVAYNTIITAMSTIYFNRGDFVKAKEWLNKNVLNLTHKNFKEGFVYDYEEEIAVQKNSVGDCSYGYYRYNAVYKHCSRSFKL